MLKSLVSMMLWLLIPCPISNREASSSSKFEPFSFGLCPCVTSKSSFLTSWNTPPLWALVKICFRIILDNESPAFTRTILRFRSQENASSSQRHNDSNCWSWDLLIVGFMDKFRRCKTRKWRRKLVFFRRCHRWTRAATVVVISETGNICFSLALGFS